MDRGSGVFIKYGVAARGFYIYVFSLQVSKTQTYYAGGTTDPLKVHFNVTARLHSTENQ